MKKVSEEANDVLVVTAAHEFYLPHDVPGVTLVKKNLLDGNNVPSPPVKSFEDRAVGAAREKREKLKRKRKRKKKKEEKEEEERQRKTARKRREKERGKEEEEKRRREEKRREEESERVERLTLSRAVPAGRISQ